MGRMRWWKRKRGKNGCRRRGEGTECVDSSVEWKAGEKEQEKRDGVLGANVGGRSGEMGL